MVHKDFHMKCKKKKCNNKKQDSTYKDCLLFRNLIIWLAFFLSGFAGEPRSPYFQRQETVIQGHWKNK